MADHTHIEWTDATWNPITGCTLVSDGCRHCYAATLAATRLKHHPSRAGLARLNAAGEAKFTGEVRFNEQWLDQPLRWRRPRRIFVCAHSDLFHESVPDEWIDRVFAVMALAPQHTFQVLTKRPERMRAYFEGRRKNFGRASDLLHSMSHPCNEDDHEWAVDQLDAFDSTGRVMHQVWLGTSIEDQATADARIPHLLATPAAVRFVSAEPLLGPVDLTRVVECDRDELARAKPGDTISGWELDSLRGDAWDAVNGPLTGEYRETYGMARLDWVIVGGESGPHARPMHADWARSLRDQCNAAGVAFFFKQWGEWGPDTGPLPGRDPSKNGSDPIMEGFGPAAFYKGGEWHHRASGYAIDPKDARGAGEWSYRLGKKRNGRLLDGRTWDEMPGVDHA